MSDEQQQGQTPPEAQSRQPAVIKAPAAVPQSRPARASATVAWLALLVALAVAAYNGWQYWLQLQLDDGEAQALASLEQHVQLLQQDSERRARDLRQQQREAQDVLRAEVRSQLGDSMQQLQALRDQLSALAGADRRDWQLAEAEYLLRLAGLRALLGRDAKGAATLLDAADDIIAGFDDSTLHPVRAAIAEEIAALRTVAQFDREGLYLDVDAAASQAAKLTLYSPPQFQAEESAGQPAAEDGWQRLRRGFALALDRLKSYVRIEQREEQFKPLLAPEAEAALRYSLQLMFEQAQLAALAGDETLYRRSLERVDEWLARYYTLDERAGAVRELVAELSDRVVNPPMPDLSPSLHLLKQYIEQRHWSRTVSETGETGVGGAP